MKQNIEELRKKYMDNPPEGITSKDIRLMSEDELLDMDYFLNDDELDDDFGEEGFYIYVHKPYSDRMTELLNFIKIQKVQERQVDNVMKK